MPRGNKHNYEYDFDLSGDSAPAKVVRMVGHNKRVLEIGAGPGSITRILKHRNRCRMTAVEIDPSAVVKLSELCEEVHQCDLNEPGWASSLTGTGTFDVIVAADVFEHLHDPQRTMAALKPLISPDGYLVVSLPHVGNNAVIATILNNDFKYNDVGLLDRTHIRFFCIKNIQDLVGNSGYRILEAEFVMIHPELTDLASQWRKLPQKVRDALEINRYGCVYQVVMKIAPAASNMDGIQLTEINIPDYVLTPMDLFKARVRPFLGPRVVRFLSSAWRKIRPRAL